MTPATPLVSVVIRVRNEEAWLRHCLEGIEKQIGASTEVIIVDNDSSDKSLEIARTFGVDKVVRVAHYTPGLALNAGVKASSGEFVAFISGHCVPADPSWLANLVAGFDEQKVAGVYGRQLPMAFTDPLDRNDLMMAFGPEAKIQRQDWFFHNANSMIRREVWEKIPFDEITATIEDRLWAKVAIESGHWIAYRPDAKVYHHNGLHRSTDVPRIREHVRVVEDAVGSESDSIGNSLNAENMVVTAIVPVSPENLSRDAFEGLFPTVEASLHASRFVQKVVVLSPDGAIGSSQSTRINRTTIGADEAMSLGDLLALTVLEAEEIFGIPDYYLYVNWDYNPRPVEFFDSLVRVAVDQGFDTTFGAVREFGHFWAQQDDGALRQIDPSFSPRSQRFPLWKALYGLGTLVRAPILRHGDLSGGRIGMIELEREQHRVGSDIGKASESTRGD